MICYYLSFFGSIGTLANEEFEEGWTRSRTQERYAWDPKSKCVHHKEGLDGEIVNH